MEANTNELHDSVQALSPEKSAQRHREVVCPKEGASPLTPLQRARGRASPQGALRLLPKMPMGHTAKINGRHASGWRWPKGEVKFGKVPVAAQLMPRMVGDALAAQAEGAQHRWQGAACPQGGAREGAGHRSAQPQQKPACII
jgi:hypothetical protein